MTRIRAIALLASAAALLGACSSTPTPTVAAPAGEPATTTSAPIPPAAPTARPAPAPSGVSLPAHLDPSSAISRELSVYFDFDDFTVKKDYAALVERHGRYLAAHPELSIKVEGNADERGSREYNLALGQKRAEAVLRALAVFGAKTSQIEPVSWGEEKPLATGHDDASWAQNRRADLRYSKQ